MKALFQKGSSRDTFLRENWPDILLVVAGFAGVFCVLVFAVVVFFTVASLHL